MGQTTNVGGDWRLATPLVLSTLDFRNTKSGKYEGRGSFFSDLGGGYTGYVEVIPISNIRIRQLRVGMVG